MLSEGAICNFVPHIFLFGRGEVYQETVLYTLLYFTLSKVWKKNILLQVRGMHCVNIEELQKLAE